MSVECYFEGGPLDGQTQAHPSAPPRMHIQMPRQNSVQYVPMGSKDPIMFDIDALEYVRELAPHRNGCVTYFDSESAARDAWVDDGYQREVQTGMLDACQSAL